MFEPVGQLWTLNVTVWVIPPKLGWGGQNQTCIPGTKEICTEKDVKLNFCSTVHIYNLFRRLYI